MLSENKYGRQKNPGDRSHKKSSLSTKIITMKNTAVKKRNIARMT